MADKFKTIIGTVRDFILRLKLAHFRLRRHGRKDSPLPSSQKEPPIHKELKQKITKMDSRASYYEFYTGRKWGDRLNYDICVNTSGRSIKELASDLSPAG